MTRPTTSTRHAAAPPHPELQPNSPFLGLGACALFDVALGSLLLAGGPERVTSPSFAAINDAGGYLPAGLLTAGLGLLIVAAAATSRATTAVMLALGALAHLALAAGFGVALLTEAPPTSEGAPRAALIGPLPWLFAAAIHLVVRLPFRRRPAAVTALRAREGQDSAR